MRDWIIKWVVEYLLNNVDKESIDKVMRQYVFPFLSTQKERLYAWIDESVESTESEIDDVIAQIIKYVIDALMPDSAESN